MDTENKTEQYTVIEKKMKTENLNSDQADVMGCKKRVAA